ncbi:hypothetical protein A0J61_04960 [Choanephora cucurbitarum]|uniref:F-box domain-containing protein n=1 Tax=Choanephora cucurbitarum TaxID=101091 RepID=A0A1C7ND40_9FUNG|nr:hypothetical protein A0J61_04960 [Choanephora cucurbitarum]
MPIKLLPYEIHSKILCYLNQEDKKQYSLVSKQWRKATMPILFQKVRITFEEDLDRCVDMFMKSQLIGDSVRSLVLDTARIQDDTSRYSKLICLTPNLMVLEVRSKSDTLYRVALEDMKQGHWKQLHTLVCRSHAVLPVLYISQGYYALASSIQDRLSFLMLDLSSTSDSLEPHCFQFPLHITRQTRFNAVRYLHCFSDQRATIQSLNDALALCPCATEIKLQLCHLDQYRDKERQIEIKSNGAVKRLVVFLYDLTEAGLDYISRKFRCVDQLELRVLMCINHVMSPELPGEEPEIESFEMAVDMIALLADYVHSINKFKILILGMRNQMSLFLAFTSLQRQGELTIQMSDGNFLCTGDTAKPDQFELTTDLFMDSFDLLQPMLIAYLKQLDKLQLESLDPGHTQLLAHCIKLKMLSMQYNDDHTYQGPILPLRVLELESKGMHMNFVNQLIAFTPRLEIVRLRLTSLESVTFDMPLISLHLLCLDAYFAPQKGILYICLIRAGIETYYRSFENQFCSIEANEFNGPDKTKVTLVCRDMKHFEVKWGRLRSNDVHIKHDF